MENAAILSVDLDAKSDFGQTAFFLACQRDRSDIIKIFMENAPTLGIDLNTVNKDGMTAFHWSNLHQRLFRCGQDFHGECSSFEH